MPAFPFGLIISIIGISFHRIRQAHLDVAAIIHSAMNMRGADWREETMRITGIEGLTFGVDNVKAASRVCRDFGLEPADSHSSTFKTLDGSWIIVRPANDPSLPGPIGAGSAPRELTFGVPDIAALEAARAELDKDRATAFDGQTLRSLDDCGLAIAFKVSTKAPVIERRSGGGAPGHVHRDTSRCLGYQTFVKPRGIAHVAWNCIDERKARGRHELGSDFFWYFDVPLGGAFGYTCDVHHVGENRKPMVLEFSKENGVMWPMQPLEPQYH
jgi:hypothetical protein